MNKIIIGIDVSMERLVKVNGYGNKSGNGAFPDLFRDPFNNTAYSWISFLLS